MSTNDEVLITRQEAAHLLRISIRTLERWEQTGRLTPTRLSPGVVRYRKTDVERLIEEGAA
jgi:excisionase family DNA binding protein